MSSIRAMIAAMLLAGGLASTPVLAEAGDVDGRTDTLPTVPAEDGNAADGARATIAFAYVAVSDIAYADFSRTWNVTGAGLAIPVEDSLTMTGSLQRENRDSSANTRGELRLAATLPHDHQAYLAVAASHGADFREAWSVNAGGEAVLDGSIALTLDGRFAEYDLDAAQGGASTVALSPGLRLNPARTGIELRAKWINLWDIAGDHRHGYSAQAAYYVGDADFLFGGYARYPDTEQGVTRTVEALHGGMRFAANERLAVRVTAERLVRDRSYKQHGLTLGIEMAL